jgi:hypothetical protein
MVERERFRLPDAELSRPALVLAQRFVQRWDLHARQLDDGSYVCVHEQLNVGLLFAHLRGEITLGAYLLDRRARPGFSSWTRTMCRAGSAWAIWPECWLTRTFPPIWREAAGAATCGCFCPRQLPGRRPGPLAWDC